MISNNQQLALKLEAKVRSFLVENRDILKMSSIDSILFGGKRVLSGTSKAVPIKELMKAIKFLSNLPRFSSAYLTLDALSELSSISEKEKEFSQKRKKIVRLNRPETPELDSSIRKYFEENKNLVSIMSIEKRLGFGNARLFNFSSGRRPLSASEMLLLIEFLSNFPRLQVDESELKEVAKLVAK